MKRMHWIFICVAIYSVHANAAQPEKLVRDTYAKLEAYNAAAQVLENEYTRKPLRPAASLRFELSDFRSGNIKEILNQPYAGLITLPTGDIISLTRGSHVLDSGPEEATFGAAWERGQYAVVFDPQWTIADAFHFEPAKYYDITSYTSYQVTVRFEGRSRTYRALALFHESPGTAETGEPEFWDAVVNGVSRVWLEKRPPYKTQSAEGGIVPVEAALMVDGSGEEAVAGSGEEPVADDSTGDSTVSEGELSSSTPLNEWFSVDIAEHISGEHGAVADFTGTCTPIIGGFQRCAVVVSHFASFEDGTLDHLTPLFAHIGSKDLKTENRTGTAGTTVQCASATGVAFSTCLLGTSCGTNAQVSLSLGIGSAGATVTGGNLWRDSNAEHFACNLPSSNCTAPLNGTCPPGSVNSGSGLCCFSPSTACSRQLANKCLMFGGDFDF